MIFPRQWSRHQAQFLSLGTQSQNKVSTTVIHSPNASVWSVISCRSIIGPYFIRYLTVTRDTYKRMIRCNLIPKLRQYLRDTIFHQDSSQPQYSVTVRSYFYRNFPNSWIERVALFTPCDCNELF